MSRPSNPGELGMESVLVDVLSQVNNPKLVGVLPTHLLKKIEAALDIYYEEDKDISHLGCFNYPDCDISYCGEKV